MLFDASRIVMMQSMTVYCLIFPKGKSNILKLTNNIEFRHNTFMARLNANDFMFMCLFRQY